MRFLVIGYGNPLRSDDGLGWRVAEVLRTQLGSSQTRLTGAVADVEIITSQQLSPELAEPISRAALVIFVDAAVPTAFGNSALDGAEGKGEATSPSVAQPGTIFERDLEPTCQSAQCFSHDLTPSTLLACAGELFGSCPKGKLFSVVGADFGMGENLSAAVVAAIPRVVQKIDALLAPETSGSSIRTATSPR